MAVQQKRLLAERSVAAAAMASSITRELLIRSVELRGEHEVVGEEGSTFTIFRLEVIGSGGGKGMMTWDVARRYTDFTRLRKALTTTKEVSRLKSKKLVNNGGVAEKFPTRYSKGNMRSKASKVKGGEDGRRSEMLAAWLAAVVEKYAQVGAVREFLVNDGSANIIADMQAVREKLLAPGAKIEGSSLSAQIGSCTLVRGLTTTEGQIGCRSPNEKSAFLVRAPPDSNSEFCLFVRCVHIARVIPLTLNVYTWQNRYAYREASPRTARVRVALLQLMTIRKKSSTCSQPSPHQQFMGCSQCQGFHPQPWSGSSTTFSHSWAIHTCTMCRTSPPTPTYMASRKS